MKQFMPDVADDVRLQVLQETADSTEITSYYRDLSQDEVEIKRKKFLDNVIQISEARAVLDKAKAAYKAVADPLEKENAPMVAEIKTRKTLATGVLFNLANHAEKIMETYNEKGEFISSRRLLPEESQAKLFVSKAGHVAQ